MKILKDKKLRSRDVDSNLSPNWALIGLLVSQKSILRMTTYAHTTAVAVLTQSSRAKNEVNGFDAL